MENGLGNLPGSRMEAKSGNTLFSQCQGIWQHLPNIWISEFLRSRELYMPLILAFLNEIVLCNAIILSMSLLQFSCPSHCFIVVDNGEVQITCLFGS